MTDPKLQEILDQVALLDARLDEDRWLTVRGARILVRDDKVVGGAGGQLNGLEIPSRRGGRSELSTVRDRKPEPLFRPAKRNG